jgi:hypothetical protein
MAHLLELAGAVGAALRPPGLLPPLARRYCAPITRSIVEGFALRRTSHFRLWSMRRLSRDLRLAPQLR